MAALRPAEARSDSGDIASTTWAHDIGLPADLVGVEASLPPETPPAEGPDAMGPSMRYSAAYERATTALALALQEAEEAGTGEGELMDPAVRAVSAADLAPAVIRMAMTPPPQPDPDGPSPGPSCPTAPATVKEAMSRPDYLAPNGWRDAQQIEIRSIEGFGAWVVVPESALRASLRDFPDRTSIGHLVPVLTCKADASGDPRAPEIVNKFRIALSDPANQSAVDIPTHSSCVDALANMAVTAVRPALKAEQDSIDVSKAYNRGKPLSAAQGGRNAFAHIPPWMLGLGSLDYRRVVNGERRFLLVVGNMPGKCDAGRIFQAVMGVFLRSFGMRQLSVDRRVWV